MNLVIELCRVVFIWRASFALGSIADSVSCINAMAGVSFDVGLLPPQMLRAIHGLKLFTEDDYDDFDLAEMVAAARDCYVDHGYERNAAVDRCTKSCALAKERSSKGDTNHDHVEHSNIWSYSKDGKSEGSSNSAVVGAGARGNSEGISTSKVIGDDGVFDDWGELLHTR